MNIRYADVPYVPASDRLKVEKLADGIYRLIVRYGFMDDVDVPKALSEAPRSIKFDLMDTTFFLSRDNLIPTYGKDMMAWRENLFIVMASNAASPMTFFKIPANRVIELGTQLEI
jgi:KUP system potassium uptake protein